MSALKNESIFFCRECGYESKKWMGQCPACKSWNSFTEENVSRSALSGPKEKKRRELPVPLRLNELSAVSEKRYDTGFAEFSRVLGGGIVPGSLVLVGGDPGIGKSTLLLQAAGKLADSGLSVLYVSGEESLSQIRLRADRTGHTEGDLRFLSETDIGTVTAVLEKEKPAVCIIDSVQTMYADEVQSAPGSVSQVRECAQRMMVLCKTQNIAAFLVGHVTKEGSIAGPRVLEHIVDTVLYFESSEGSAYRILRAAKNRFGPTSEIGVFEMRENGLAEVTDPSGILLSGRPEHASGAVVTCLMEGTRPVLMEVQGLVTGTSFGNARRQASGLDYNRLNLLLAVLEKRCGIFMSKYDAYVNIAGGMRVSEPAVDLAVVAAVISSYKNAEIPPDVLVFGEVGLSGEVRAVPHAEERVKEAAKLGFSHVVLPEACLKRMRRPENIRISGIRYISELFKLI